MTTELFDSALIQSRQQRFAAVWHEHNFLHRIMAQRLLERLDDVRRPLAMGKILGDRPGILAGLVPGTTQWHAPGETTPADVVLDFARLHAINDVVAAMLAARQLLKPDGLYLAVFVGGDSFKELRLTLQQSELALYGGASPRVHPMIDVRDAGALLHRTGFALPVADVDTMHLDYSHPWQLVQDIRRTGAANALIHRHRRPLSHRFWQHVFDTYQRLYSRADGRVTATVQLLFLTGWAPAHAQPKAVARGSAQASFKDVL